MAGGFTFDTKDIFNLEKQSIISGSKEQLRFNFIDDITQEPLDITTSTIIWTLSQFGDIGYTLLKKEGVQAGETSVIVTLNSDETQELSGKFIQQVSIMDFQGNRIKSGQGILHISESNDDGTLKIKI